MPLRGKAIVITGAGKGIGAACALHLARLGASVVVNDVDAAAIAASTADIVAAGGRAIGKVADIAAWDQAGALIESCRDAFGAVDGLVNNAALFAMGRLDETDPAALARLLAVNVSGTVHTAAHAIKHMQGQGRGAIVNITSGAQMGIPAMGIYAATKGAVASLTYSWALELEGTGIRINAVSPMAMTGMGDITGKYFADHGRADAPKNTVPPMANAAVIAYLLSDAAAAVRGQVVRIENEHLSLLSHPAVMLPVLHRAGGWDFAAVAQAFASDLAARQAPLGIIGARIEDYRAASEFWKQPAGA